MLSISEQLAQSFSILDRVGNTTSRKEKEAFLAEGMKNGVLHTLLHETYNNFRHFYIKKSPVASPSGTSLSADRYKEFLLMLDMLHEREITGNEALEVVKKFFTHCNSEEFKWYLKVLQKDLKIGITEKTINKVFPDLVPTFSCMLALKITDVKQLPKRVMHDPKLDGYRCLGYHNNDGTTELRTRNGNLIFGYDGIEEDLKALPRGYIYDGEILGADKSFGSIQKSAFKKGKGKDGILNLFDCVTIEEFDTNSGTTPYWKRQEHLKCNSGAITAASHLGLVPTSEILDTSDPGFDALLASAHAANKAAGFEGTMVKDADAPYICDRVAAVLKWKDMDTIDLVVCDVEEGTAGTQNEGVLGALVVEYKGCRVNVGSGYTAAERADFWARRADLINRTIEVQYQEETRNQKNGYSLRFPIFIRIRDDK